MVADNWKSLDRRRFIQCIRMRGRRLSGEMIRDSVELMWQLDASTKQSGVLQSTWCRRFRLFTFVALFLCNLLLFSGFRFALFSGSFVVSALWLSVVVFFHCALSFFRGLKLAILIGCGVICCFLGTLVLDWSFLRLFLDWLFSDGILNRFVFSLYRIRPLLLLPPAEESTALGLSLGGGFIGFLVSA